MGRDALSRPDNLNLVRAAPVMNGPVEVEDDLSMKLNL